LLFIFDRYPEEFRLNRSERAQSTNLSFSLGIVRALAEADSTHVIPNGENHAIWNDQANIFDLFRPAIFSFNAFIVFLSGYFAGMLGARASEGRA